MVTAQFNKRSPFQSKRQYSHCAALLCYHTKGIKIPTNANIKSGGVAMGNTQTTKLEGKELYDKIQLQRLNRFAFESGMIDEKTKLGIDNKIWAK